MATNYDQPVSNQTIVQSIQHLDAPAAVIAQIVNQIGTSNTGSSQVNVFTAQPTAAQVGGNGLVQIQTNPGSGGTPVVLDLSGLTVAQQQQLVALIFTGSGDFTLTSDGSSTTSAVVSASGTTTHALTAAASSGGGLHGTVVLGTGNNQVNVTTSQALTISIPNATTAGHLSAPGQSAGTWNSVINLSGTGTESITAGSGQDYIATGSGNSFVTLQGNNNSIDSVVGGAGNDVVTIAGQFQGTATIDGGLGNNSLVLNSPIFTTGLLANGLNEFTLSNGSKVDFTNIRNFVLAQDAVSGNAQNLANIAAITGDISVTAGNGNYNLLIGNGNDSVSLGVGNDSLTTGTGNDSVTLGGGKDSIAMGSGNDTISLKSTFQGSANVDGGGGANTLDLSLVSVRSTLRNPDGSVLITLNNGATVNAAHIQNFIYTPGQGQAATANTHNSAVVSHAVNAQQASGTSGQTNGGVVVVGVQDLLTIFNHF